MDKIDEHASFGLEQFAFVVGEPDLGQQCAVFVAEVRGKLDWAPALDDQARDIERALESGGVDRTRELNSCVRIALDVGGVLFEQEFEQSEVHRAGAQRRLVDALT